MNPALMAALTFAGIGLLFGFKSPSDGETVRLYVGTYTNGDSKGIYHLDLNLETGALSSPRLAAKSVNPSFLAIHPTGGLLLAVNETVEWNGMKSGAVSSFRIDPKSGKLKLVNQRASGGRAPCYLIVDPTGKFALVANYAGGSVASLPIRQDGTLHDAVSLIQHEGSSVNPDRQEAPHAHSINLDAANRFALAADLGIDQVLVYEFDPKTGILSSHNPAGVSLAPGAGPRHLSFHPNGRVVYVVNELDLTVTVFSYHPQKGELTEIQTITTLPDVPQEKPAPAEYSTAEILVHPTGRFVYASNRGHDTIVVFRVDQQTGRLTAVEHMPTQGRTPRNFRIDPTGQFLVAANQATDNLVVFRINQETGHLETTGHSARVPAPVCIKFVER